MDDKSEIICVRRYIAGFFISTKVMSVTEGKNRIGNSGVTLGRVKIQWCYSGVCEILDFGRCGRGRASGRNEGDGKLVMKFTVACLLRQACRIVGAEKVREKRFYPYS